MKKSVAAAIVAATPMALTGLVNAEGGGGCGTGSESGTGFFSSEGSTNTTGFFDTTTYQDTTVAEPLCVEDQEREFLHVQTDANGDPLEDQNGLVAFCWRPMDGCDFEDEDGNRNCWTSNIPRRCNLNPNSSGFDVACLDLDQQQLPPICPQLMAQLA